MVERSLEAMAADRGITICFTDLDGADGLWVPEERTILLSRTLSARRAAEVLEHELSHVDIEDGHAALDASMHRHPRNARWAVGATALVSLTLLVGTQLQSTPRRTAETKPAPQVGAVIPSEQRGAPRLTEPPPPTTTVTVTGGRTITVTVTASPPAASTSTPPASSPYRPVSVPPLSPATGTPSPSVTATGGSTPSPTTSPSAPPPTTTEPAATSPASTATVP